jgi:hypothetical protein
MKKQLSVKLWQWPWAAVAVAVADHQWAVHQ